MRPDPSRLLKAAGIKLPLIGIYDAPDPEAFAPLVEPKTDGVRASSQGEECDLVAMCIHGKTLKAPEATSPVTAPLSLRRAILTLNCVFPWTGGIMPARYSTRKESVRASLENGRHALQLGASDFVSKPFDHVELLRVIERVLKNKPGSQDKISVRPQSTEPASQ